ncbi:FAD-dependent oxidoreductase [Eggerthella sp. YY7918]|uniref:FAD-dependent oxidoreductase n=1 Tax=Eggerthella sp. (strain YY7918) TaxID=502558 RepID=UPI0002171290|nr:FAD-dependent oxidoreductase [Eggerthella sp. YY7918]BAK45286.1 succinate dehydrogenase [Eggerthella sp. YY7918]
MSMDRRSFLKGTLAVGGVAAAGALVGCSPAKQSESAAQAAADSEAADWLGSAPDVTVEECEESKQADVVIVGSALAGVLAAYAALKEGASVIVLERNGYPHISGSGIGFLNSRYQLENGQPEQNVYKIIADVFNQFQLRADISLLSLWGFHSGEILDAIEEDVLQPAGCPGNVPVQDIPADRAGQLAISENCHVDFDPEGNDSLEKFIFAFHDWIKENGGQIDVETCARKLVQAEDGTVTGLIATNAEGKYVYYEAAKGVVMCTGSYGGDERMLDAFCPDWLAKYAKTYNSYNARASETCPVTTTEKMDDGTGHKMMCWAGAVMEQIDPPVNSWFGTGYYWWPFLHVDVRGRRFMNESGSWLCTTHTLAELPDGVNYCWQIKPTNDFDMPMTVPTGIPLSAWEEVVESSHEYYEADTIKELADLIEVDKDTLVETIERYNELCVAGCDEDYGKLPKYLDPIDDPPYRAVKATINFYATANGVKCNNKLQVLDSNWDPIPGLYAAGNCVGWRMGSGYQDIVPGLCNALSLAHGYFAGKNCAA